MRYLQKVPVPEQVKVGPETIPELATLLADNVPALSVPLLVRVPEVVRLVIATVVEFMNITGTPETTVAELQKPIVLLFGST